MPVGFEALVGFYPINAIWCDAGSHAGLFSHLRKCCLEASQAAAGFRIPCCSSILRASYCNSSPHSRGNIRQAVTSGVTAPIGGIHAGGDGRCSAREYAGAVGGVPGISKRAYWRALRILGAAERVWDRSAHRLKLATRYGHLTMYRRSVRLHRAKSARAPSYASCTFGALRGSRREKLR